jgi:hypothetical protein
MAFTRFHDDPCRIIKQLQQQTDQGRWIIDVPGNGTKPCFMLDPQIIPQKWGANLWTHSTDIQSSLLGIDKTLNRDCLDQNKYKTQTIYSSPIDYPVCDTFLTTEQSRVTMPAWTFRDLPQNHAYILPDNPQTHTEMPFGNYASTRILEKDNFVRQFDCIPNNDQIYTLPTQQYNQTNKSARINNVCSNSCKQI